MGPGLRAVPVSMPQAYQWPNPEQPRPWPGTVQPPLPWESGQQAPPAHPAQNTREQAHDLTGPNGVRVNTRGVAGGPAPAAGLPDPAHSAIRLAQGILEALQGLRPVRQLSRWLDEPVLALVTLHTARRAGRQPPARLASVHLQCPSAVSVEAVALCRSQDHAGAMALRLDARGQHWLCTAWEARLAPVRHTGSMPAVSRRA